MPRSRRCGRPVPRLLCVDIEVVCGLRRRISSSSTGYPVMSQHIDRVPVAGGHLDAAVVGSGPAVLLIHGSLQATAWDTLLGQPLWVPDTRPRCLTCGFLSERRSIVVAGRRDGPSNLLLTVGAEVFDLRPKL